MGRKVLTEVEKAQNPLTDAFEASPVAMAAMESLVMAVQGNVDLEFTNEEPARRKRRALAAISQMAHLLLARAWDEEIAEQRAEIERMIRGDMKEAGAL